MTDLPTPASGDVWGTQLNAAITERVNSKIAKLTVGPGLTVDAADPQNPILYRTDYGPLTQGRFRGEWNLRDAVVYSQDFSGSSSLPAEFTNSVGTGGTSQRVVSPTLSSTTSGYAYAWQLADFNGSFSPNVYLSFRPYNSTNLVGKYVTKMRYLWGYSGTASAFDYGFNSDGTRMYTVTPPATQAWTDVTHITQDFTVADFGILNNPGTSANQGGIYITGIQIYAADTTFKYNLGDTVTYGGLLYRCTVTGTVFTPGTSSAWVQIPFTFEPGGTYQSYITTQFERIGARIDNVNDTFWSSGSGPLDYEFDTDDLTGTLPGDFVWFNQGASTYSQQLGAGVITHPGSSSDTVRGIARTIPPTTSWTATAKLSHMGQDNSAYQTGICLRDSVSGKLATFGPRFGQTLGLLYWTNPTTYASRPVTDITTPTDVRYIRVTKTSATSWAFAVSNDGLSWYTHTTALNVSTFLTPDQIGFFIYRANTATLSTSIHWLRVR